jgi:hypothetical protein
MSPGIAPILCAGAIAQIGDAVISALVVDVIDFRESGARRGHEAGEPMRAINSPTDFNVAISVSAPSARFAACACAAASHPPIKKPRFRGVIEQFSQALCRQLSFQFAEHEGSLPKAKRPAADRGSGRNSRFQFFRSNGTLFAPTFPDGANRRAALRKSAPTYGRSVIFRAHK